VLIITVLKYCIVSFKKGPSWSWSYDSLDLQLLVQLMPITTKIVSSNPADGEVYLIQHYMKKIVSDLRQVNDFLRVVSSIKKIITEILLKVVLSTITLTICFVLQFIMSFWFSFSDYVLSFLIVMHCWLSLYLFIVSIIK
jgi:hypothetical protein